MTTLFLATSAYPYLPGEEFLETEIKYLAQEFDRVTILPGIAEGERRPIPDNCEVKDDLARSRTSRSPLSTLLRIFASLPIFTRSLAGHPTKAMDLRYCRSLMGNACVMREAKKGIRKAVKRELLHKPDMPFLFYSYWYTARTYAAVSLSMDSERSFAVVTRAHNGDCFLERTACNAFPLRKSWSSSVLRIFPCSDKGTTAVRQQIKTELVNTVKTSRLGVENPCCRNPAPEKHEHKILSCSYAVPIKRIDLIADAVLTLALRDESKTITWTHFGDGPCIDEVRSRLGSPPGNLILDFRGQTTNSQILEAYKNEAFSVFVNCSLLEGIPVSIMEAYSHGIPAVATCVGGTPEIVNDLNGKVVPVEIDGERLADCLSEVIERGQDTRDQAYKTFADNYDASKNYNSFAKGLRKFCEDNRGITQK